MNWLVNWIGTTNPWCKGWFGAESVPTFEGYGDPGVFAFVLDIENGFRVTQGWITDIIKVRSGKEQRISRNDRGRETYGGSVVMFGDIPVAIRTNLARYAALGAQFRLALPHEQLSLRADSSGTTVPVHSTALVDWAKRGQRVVVARRGTDGEIASVSAVIQSKTADTIVLDVSPGSVGLFGAVIMPTVPVLLEPQQDFARYPTNAEVWELSARASMFDFAPTLASLALGPLTVTASFDNATVTSRQFGLQGNQISFFLDGDAGYPNAGQLVEGLTLGFPFTVFRYKPGVTTVQNMIDALNTSAYVLMTGATSPSSTIAAGDEFSAFLTGATDVGDIGTGATVATYVSRPVWDRRIDNNGTNTDSIQAMTEIIDHGGVPYAIGDADQADWGRAVALEMDGQAQWQWLKKFLATVKGRQKAFWLPTWRDDLPFVSKSTNVITVEADDFAAWWPAQRKHIQIVETDGTLTRREITAAVNNGNGTWTLTIGVTLATSSVEMVSWLELCRFESDEFPIGFADGGFAL